MPSKPAPDFGRRHAEQVTRLGRRVHPNSYETVTETGHAPKLALPRRCCQYVASREADATSGWSARAAMPRRSRPSVPQHPQRQQDSDSDDGDSDDESVVHESSVVSARVTAAGAFGARGGRLGGQCAIRAQAVGSGVGAARGRRLCIWKGVIIGEARGDRRSVPFVRPWECIGFPPARR
jgi:hypothetical protein